PRRVQLGRHGGQIQSAALLKEPRVQLIDARAVACSLVGPNTDPLHHDAGFGPPGAQMPEQVLDRPSIGREPWLQHLLTRHGFQQRVELVPTSILGSQEVFSSYHDQPSLSGRNSKARSPIRTSSPRRAPRAASCLSTPSFASRFWSCTTSRGSSKSVSATHRSTARPTTRKLAPSLPGPGGPPRPPRPPERGAGRSPPLSVRRRRSSPGRALTPPLRARPLGRPWSRRRSRAEAPAPDRGGSEEH